VFVTFYIFVQNSITCPTNILTETSVGYRLITEYLKKHTTKVYPCMKK